MARYSFSNCGVAPRRSRVAERLLGRGQTASWLAGNMIITITVSGCAQQAGRPGFYDSCWSGCRPAGAAPEEETAAGPGRAKSRHQNDQSDRVRSEAAGPGLESGPGRGVEEGTGEGVCGCWCQGWAEVMVRRPAGVTSWVCRVQGGLLSSQPCQETDLTLVTKMKCLHCVLFHCCRQTSRVRSDPTSVQSRAEQRCSEATPARAWGSRGSPSQRSPRRRRWMGYLPPRPALGLSHSVPPPPSLPGPPPPPLRSDLGRSQLSFCSSSCTRRPASKTPTRRSRPARRSSPHCETSSESSATKRTKWGCFSWGRARPGTRRQY